MKQQAKYVRSKIFWDKPDLVEKRFNNWMMENGDLTIIAIDTNVKGVEEEGYGYWRTTTNVIYLITEEMYEEELKKKKEKEEWLNREFE